MPFEKRAPYDVNRVTRYETGHENARNYSGEKELISCYKFIAPNPNYDAKATHRQSRYAEPIIVKCWMGRSASASTVYASVWAHSRKEGFYSSGRGNAGGYGYHKESAAVNDAFNNAGFTFEKPFSGCGDQPIEVAIKAVARRLGWKTGDIVKL